MIGSANECKGNVVALMVDMENLKHRIKQRQHAFEEGDGQRAERAPKRLDLTEANKEIVLRTFFIRIMCT